MPMSTTPAEGYAERVRASFAAQRIMATIGASLAHVAPGAVHIVLPVRPDLGQQHGFVHAGVVATIADSACGYAAFTLMPEGVGVLSIEYKINLLAPADGERLLARARVVRAGRNVSVCQADVVAQAGGDEKLVAVMTATMMTVRDRPEIVG